MSSRWHRSASVGMAALTVAGSLVISVTGSAWASVSAQDSVPVASAPVSPTPSASASHLPAGCTGVTPKKPWRLVATRPNPAANAVTITWSAVGCTVGYRVHIVGAGVDRLVEVAGGSSSTTSIPDLPPSTSYRITVTSVGASEDGGVSGDFGLHRSAPASHSDLSIDFPDPVTAEMAARSVSGPGPWVNPELTWTAAAGQEPKSYRVKVTGSGGTTVVEKTVAGSATKTRLGDEIAAGVPYTVTLTPVMSDGSDGNPARLAFGDKRAPQPEQVTGNAPVVQFSPVTDQQLGRVLGYEIAFGALRASKHLFVPAPSGSQAAAPWVAVDPSFAAVDASDTAVPLAKLTAVVRTITTTGRSAWTSAHTIAHAEVATASAAYFAGIGHVDGGAQTVPRTGFLNVRGSVADVEVTDLVWAQSARQQALPVTVVVYGAAGSGSPSFTQELAVTHLPGAAQDAWRASDIPLPDGWTSVVLRRAGTDVATWVNTAGTPCVRSVTFADAPTDLPEMWKDSWCTT